MNFEHLKVFHMAAKKRNFSETAKLLHMSQPSISLQIRQLEESLNIKLFKRTTRKVDLTPAGEILFNSSEKILNLIHQTEQEIALLSDSNYGVLNIGASMTIGEHILPYALGKYKKEYPNVNIILEIYNTDQIIEKLVNEEIHLAFVQSMISYPKYRQLPFFEDKLILIASNNYTHPLLDHQQRSISLNDMFSLPLILREAGSGTRQVIEEQLRRNKLNPEKLQIILELENTQSIKSAVESGMGLSIISQASVQHELRLKTLRQFSIEGMNLKRNFYSVYDEKRLTSASESFLLFLHNYYSMKSKTSV
ncbi:LysR family transcriptional regulator [Bacillus sp. FJAT-29790]|uniref:selenium metabolism-associated LysR family transcriptional regulator n=1 Tax=Bacillus sp. FJAT-29790 TaxID=1895002 RepID=UPI001C226B03|nr:selenium metabolism-associated LysR family transcriptional regulator [Bacillus sp. FJAT-29790]MBU8878112.1 LysR family transcriptional regulator [Bacillus sp. FJAT-29790]